jgi:hypothetical protein
MPDYSQGKIYRLTCNVSGLNYYGSTTQPLYKRLYEHKKCYEGYLKNERNKLTAFKIIEGGNFEIILVEEYPCENRSQLERRERFYIESNECVNKNIPTRTSKEYYILNSEIIRKQKRGYYNSEIIKKQKKDYYILNREIIRKKQNDYKIEYYKNNKDKLKIKRDKKNKSLEIPEI